jgi:hypothetical protein
MSKKLFLILFFFLCPLLATAQMSTVTGTITDGAAQAYANGTWKAEFIKSPTGSGSLRRTDTLALVDSSSLSATGSLSAVGAFSTSLLRNDFVTPSGSQWRFTFCPLATTNCFTYQATIAAGAVDIGAAASAIAPIINVSIPSDYARSVPRAYQDGEVSGYEVGSQYFDISTYVPKWWNGTVWFPAKLGGSGYVACHTLFALNAGAQINACIQALPAAGGIADASMITLTSINELVDIDRSVTLLLPVGQLTCTVTPCFNVEDNFIIVGQGRGNDENPGATSIKAATNGTVFNGVGRVRHFSLENLGIVGNGTGSAVVTPTFVASTGDVDDWDGVLLQFDGVSITDFTEYPVIINKSVNQTRVRDTWFLRNTGCIDSKWASDLYVEHSDFWRTNGTNPCVRARGGSIVVIATSIFIKSNGDTTVEDIMIDTTDTDGKAGFIWIDKNKFGPEGESATRPKIRFASSAADATDTARNVKITDNDFSGNSSTECAIVLDSPIETSIIERNYFAGFSTCLVDDAFAPPSQDAGKSIFRGNRVLAVGATAATAQPKEFLNSGRGFLFIEPVGYGPQPVADTTPRDNETPGLDNRIARSQDLNNFAVKSGITVTSGQTDPFGGTGADLLTKAGGASAERVEQTIDMTGSPTTLYASCWFKADSLTTVQFGIRDATASKLLYHFPLFNLDSTWRRYKVTVAGIPTPTNTHRLTIYPDNFTQADAGTIYAFGCQVSDKDSDYLPTTTTALTSTAGNRVSRTYIFGNTAPFTVPSGASKVTNLDADKLDGLDSATAATASTIAARDANGDITGRVLISTVTTGTAPFTAASTTKVSNLNVDQVDGISILSGSASLDFTALAANSCEVLTIGSVTGAADGNTVAIGVPNALADVDGGTERTTFFAWVSGTDTISVRRCNVTGSATAEPAAATVTVKVMQ